MARARSSTPCCGTRFCRAELVTPRTASARSRESTATTHTWWRRARRRSSTWLWVDLRACKLLRTNFSSFQSVKQLANALCQEKLCESSLVRIFWPRERCSLLRDDVVFVDSPGVDVSQNLDDWIDNHCLNADVFVLVLNAESTMTLAVSFCINWARVWRLLTTSVAGEIFLPRSVDENIKAKYICAE